MARILNTDGNTISLSAARFEAYDVIRYSANYEDGAVKLHVTTGGVLDLSDELGSVAATITAGSAAIRLTSGDGDDTLSGSGRGDRLSGGFGNDTLIGGAGNDVLNGGDGDDVFQLSGNRSGVDTFRGGEGTADTLEILNNTQLSRLTLDERAGIEVLRFQTGYGESLSGTTKADVFDLSGVQSYVNLGTYRAIHLSAGNDRLIGSQASDLVYGDAGNDTLRGGTGDDTLVGGAGRDALYGGDGNDTFIVSGASSGVDLLRGGEGEGDTLRLEANTQLSHLTLDAAASVEVMYFYTPSESLSGTAGADVFDLSGVQSYAQSNDIHFNGGNDIAVGSLAADEFYGDSGRDTLQGGAGEDTLVGGSGNDRLYGGADDDLFLISGNDSGVDRFPGGDGTSDTLRTENNTRLASLTLDTNASVEVLDLYDGTRGLAGTTGNDRFDLSGVQRYVNTGATAIRLDAGDDQFVGAIAADTVYGDAGSDTLRTGAGSDVLHGGLGNDTLAGGDGDDRFVFDTALNAASNVDTLEDFVSGDDSFVLDRSLFNALSYGQLGSANFVQGTAATTADQHIIYNDATGNLYYDADGSGAGAAVLFAHVAAHTTLVYSDFFGD